MVHNILGAGMETEILTGRPRTFKSLEEQKAEENLKTQKAIQEQFALTTELPHVLPVIAGQLEKRIIELMAADPKCKAFLEIIGSFASKMEAVKNMATKIRRQSMGVHLNLLTDETKIAPGEGIPIEE